MTRGRAWYVKARRLDLSWRLVSGPFDDHGPAYDEARRIRPFYPDVATLDVILHVGKSLPERRPRSCPPGYTGTLFERMNAMGHEFDLSKPAGRLAAAAALVERIGALGCRATREDWDSEPDVSASSPSLNAQIWLAWTPAAPMPIISWYGAAFPLRDTLPGCWTNGGPRKATSKPGNWPELWAALEIGLLAGIDGGAFDL